MSEGTWPGTTIKREYRVVVDGTGEHHVESLHGDAWRRADYELLRFACSDAGVPWYHLRTAEAAFAALDALEASYRRFEEQSKLLSQKTVVERPAPSEKWSRWG